MDAADRVGFFGYIVLNNQIGRSDKREVFTISANEMLEI
jgi:hypothetical protein